MGEFESSDKAGLLVQAAQVTDKVDDSVLFLKGFIGQGLCICSFDIFRCSDIMFMPSGKKGAGLID